MSCCVGRVCVCAGIGLARRYRPMSDRGDDGDSKIIDVATNLINTGVLAVHEKKNVMTLMLPLGTYNRCETPGREKRQREKRRRRTKNKSPAPTHTHTRATGEKKLNGTNVLLCNYRRRRRRTRAHDFGMNKKLRVRAPTKSRKYSLAPYTDHPPSALRQPPFGCSVSRN